MTDQARTSGNLPAELTSFVGRRRELAEIKKLLANSRLVTLTGVGGVGKTRLASRAGAELRRSFPDGVWLVSLAELRDPALLSGTIAGTLGLRGDNAVAGLVEYLEDKQLLLILDNCEHLVPALAVLAAKLLPAAPGVRILATSRQVLRTEGEQVLPVRPLSVPDPGEPGNREAVTLFADRAAAVLRGFEIDAANRETVTRICRRLDGIPLAIELAAVRLRVLSLDQVLTRIDQRFRLLTTGTRTARPRQQTLEATMAWSFDLCTEAEQRVWESVSVFSGGFDLDGAEAVCAADGIERHEVPNLVAGMVDKSILVRRNGTYGRNAWYQMLETIREYGQVKLAESGREDAVRARHVAYCLDLARQYAEQSFSDRQLEWIERIRREHASLRVALKYCLAAQKMGSGGLPPAGRPAPQTAPWVRSAMEITARLGNYWYASGKVPEGYRWLATVLAIDTAETPARAYALYRCAFMAAQVGDSESAYPMIDELRSLAEKFDDDRLRAGHAQCVGLAQCMEGDLTSARASTEEAIAGFRALGDAEETHNTLAQLALVDFFLEDPAGAAAAGEALTIAQERGAVWSGNYARWPLAAHHWRQGDYRRATALLRESIAMRLADRTQLAFAIEALAWCAGSAGQHERAAGLLGAAHAVWRLSGARISEKSPHQSFDEQCAERARAGLGEERFADAFEAMAGASLEEAVAFALDEKQASPRSRSPARRAARSGGLTRREREIADLVAEGLSNREIAAKLVIAQRTAETHVENILAKLGFTSRAQIAAWLAEQRAGS